MSIRLPWWKAATAFSGIALVAAGYLAGSHTLAALAANEGLVLKECIVVKRASHSCDVSLTVQNCGLYDQTITGVVSHECVVMTDSAPVQIVRGRTSRVQLRLSAIDAESEAGGRFVRLVLQLEQGIPHLEGWRFSIDPPSSSSAPNEAESD